MTITLSPTFLDSQIRVTVTPPWLIPTCPANTHGPSDSLMPSMRHRGLLEEILPSHALPPTDSPIMGKEKGYLKIVCRIWTHFCV